MKKKEQKIKKKQITLIESVDLDNNGKTHCIAKGTYKEALTKLIELLNGNYIDTENCNLKITNIKVNKRFIK